MSEKQPQTITLTPHDLPLYCSGPDNEAWSGHPRVFLPIKSNSSIECPYCGTVYHMDGEIKGDH